MELDVSKAFATPATAYPFQAVVTLPPQEVGGETIRFDPVSLQGTYSAYEGVVSLEGTFSTVAHGACAMCMRPADCSVEADFAEVFRKDANEAEDECFRYENKSVPLAHMTLTLIMLALPVRFLCEDGCRGSEELQAWMKQNSVSSELTEGEPPTTHPFANLKSLLDNKPEP